MEDTLLFDAVERFLNQEMTAQDVAKLKASMSAAEQAELTRKIRLARQMGIIK